MYIHRDIPLHCAHTLVDVAGPSVCGGRTRASVAEATWALIPMAKQRDQEGEDRGAYGNHMGHGSQGVEREEMEAERAHQNDMGIGERKRSLRSNIIRK